jgi:hypothetical protein
LTTTFGSYGQVAPHQQGELVRNPRAVKDMARGEMEKLITLVSDLHSRFAKDA